MGFCLIKGQQTIKYNHFNSGQLSKRLENQKPRRHSHRQLSVQKCFQSLNQRNLQMYYIAGFHCHATKIKSKLMDKNSQEFVILQEIISLSTLPSLRSLQFFVLELAVKMFYKNLQSSAWKRHSCVPERDTVMVAGNQ